MYCSFLRGLQLLGITSFANKFPTMLATINNIFLLAWTENSIYEYKSEDKAEYYSKSLQMFIVVVLLICSLMLPATKVYFELFIDSQYSEAIGLVPIMFIAMIFNAVASFLGTIYTASMKTKDAFYTTVVAAISNIVLCFVLIPMFNIYGFALANAISYILFYIVRKNSVNKIVKLKENYKEYITPIMIFLLTMIAYYMLDFKANILYEIVLIIIICVCYYKLIKDILKNKLKKKN